ncbi:tetratricopeptide repeat protein [Streptomyces albicerus]|uniref:tetratricopeptide repeat protein n=1 Tax=Streptomyces albicerus TaxID=2569859 RepID=UPI00124B85A3|nr:tetratricopeptide repeat protein [Streptomyces albicerus]
MAWRAGRLAAMGAGLVRLLSAVARPVLVAFLGTPGAAVAGPAGAAAASGGQALDRVAARQQALPGLLRLSRRGRVPTVADARDPVWLGVHPAAPNGGGTAGLGRVPAFIDRDMMPQVEAALSAGEGVVLLVGESTAGKSRLAYEVMRAHFPKYRLVVPDSRESMVSLVDLVVRMRRAVVWLDELDVYLGVGGLTAGQVQRMLGAEGARVVILATMSAQQHGKFGARSGADDEPGRDVLRGGREVIRLATTVRIDRRWSPAEIARAEWHADDPRIRAAVNGAGRDGHGVAEYLAAAPQLLDEWHNAWSTGTHPRAAALVAAAADARRVGYHQPLPAEVLRRMHEGYLERRGGTALRPESWEDALTWATEPLHATSSLLLPHDGDHHQAFDYLHHTLDEQVPPPRIPAAIWETLIEHAGATEALNIGTTAYQRGDLSHAMAAFEKAGLDRGRLPRQWYATCVGEAGNPARAAALYEELVSESTSELGPDARETLENRNAYARYVGMAGRPAEAVDLLRGVVADRVRVLGADHSHTLNSRNNLALFLGESGRIGPALAEFEAVLADRTRLLGADHPHTLSTRYGHAYLLGDAGRPAHAARLFESLVADRTRTQGPYHPYTLNNRRHHAHFLGESGHAAQAAALFEELIQDCLQVLDADHPDTVAARHGHARFLGESGDPARAAVLLTELLADANGDGARDGGTHGSRTPVALVWRRYRAFFTGEAGDPDQAARLLDELLTDSRSVLDEGHPHLFAIRAAHARSTGRRGQVQEAVELYAQLVDDCRPVLGDDHPHTLAARSGHARCLGSTGRAAEAADLLEILVQDRARVLGDDHPATLGSRNAHARCVGEAGDRARAVRLLRTILQDRLRYLGEEHPWTLRTRQELVDFQ